MVLPHPSLLFYDQALPQLSRRPSEAAAASALPAPPQTPPSSSPCSSASLVSARRSLASPGSSSSAAAAAAAGAAPQGSLPPAGALGGDAEDAPAAAADGGAVGRWLQRLRRRRLLRLHGSRTVPVGELLCAARVLPLASRGGACLPTACTRQVSALDRPSSPLSASPARPWHAPSKPTLLIPLTSPPPPPAPAPPPPQHTHTHTHTHTHHHHHHHHHPGCSLYAAATPASGW